MWMVRQCVDSVKSCKTEDKEMIGSCRGSSSQGSCLCVHTLKEILRSVFCADRNKT